MKLFRLAQLMPILLAGSCGNAAERDAAAAVAVETPKPGPFIVGVQTHFGQNWQSGTLRIAQEAPVDHYRDTLRWASVEKEKGRLDFAGTRLPNVQALCANKGKLMLTVVPRNPLYEADYPVASPEGQQAFVTYVEALLNALPGCVDAIEVGNEINNSKGLGTLDGKPGKDEYVALVGKLNDALDRSHPQVAVLGGSSNAVATGFLASLFERGLLDHADGIVVHPYRNHAESLGWELRRLKTVMAQYGKILPIWATEFGDGFEALDDGAPAVIKLVSIMSAEGVERAYWYALVDQKWFPNMGLYTERGQPHAASRGLAFAEKELLNQGRAVAASTDPMVRMYRFGKDRWVMWGAPRPLQLEPGTKLFDAFGNPVTRAVLGGAPLIAIGPQPKFGPTEVIADSLYQFGGSPWSYAAMDSAGKNTELGPLDSQYDTSLGNRYLRPFRIADSSIGLTGTRDRPLSAVLRYASPGPQKARLRLCVRPNPQGDGVALIVKNGGRVLMQRDFKDAGVFLSEPLDLSAQSPLEITFGPAGTSKQHNSFSYRAQLFTGNGLAAQCPADFVGWTA